MSKTSLGNLAKPCLEIKKNKNKAGGVAQWESTCLDSPREGAEGCG